MFEQMIGKTYMYNAKEYIIEGASYSGDYMFVDTNKKVFRFHKDEVQKKASQFLPIDNTKPAKQAPAGIAPQISSLKTVTESLIECIEIVKRDPNYIKQANSINSTIKTITQVMRLELDMMKLRQSNDR